MDWTPEQKKAIETRGCNLLVAAGAGSGKTAVLVERIIKMITDENNPVDIDRLLVVTFTNAAASEMRDRIGDALSRELEKNPDSLMLQRQIVLLNKASITTMHSFCLEVIRSNFHMIDLDPMFRIADETECILIKQEILNEMFDEEYENENLNEEFIELVECYGGGRGDEGLKNIVLDLYTFSQSTPWPNDWLTDACLKFNVNDKFDFGKSEWAKVLLSILSTELSGILQSYKKAYMMLDGVKELEAYRDHIKGELDYIKSLTTCNLWDDFIKKLSELKFEKLPTLRKVFDKETQEAVKNIRDEVKKQVNKIINKVKLSSTERIIHELNILYPLMKCLINLTIEFKEKYQAKKKEKCIIDFNDIEHYCIKILTEKNSDGSIVPSKVAMRYRDKFEEVLVDEYQDSNMVQELILSVVSRKDMEIPNLFMVGDVKQSIYRFRQAKPELFLQKYNTYKEFGREKKILLYKNFRSREEIIDAVNYIFKSIMSVDVGEMEYDDEEELNPGAIYPALDKENMICSDSVEVHIIENSKLDENIDDTESDENIDVYEDIDSVQLEARMVAKNISDLIKSNFAVYDKSIGEYRKVEYRDIVILMRATSSTASVFLEELSSIGIPAYADTSGGYFEVAEVQTMLSLLKIIDNPMQDIPLIAVLRSPISSFTPDELIEIRMADREKTFFEALKIKAQASDGEISNKVSDFLNNLDRWRKKSINMPLSDFIWYLYNDTGYFAYAGAMPGGMQRQANLRILFERAKQYEDTSLKGLFNFINFIDKLKNSSGDMGSAKTVGENENVVRIMSIHKSKGLEFPVVFVSGLGRRFNLKDLKRTILFHHDLGLGPDFVDYKKRFSYATIMKLAIKEKMKLESYSEEMRILYVALTRAKEKLIITGTVQDFEKAFNKWGEGIDSPGNKIPVYQILKGTNYLDWICPALLKHCECKDFREEAKIKIMPSSIVDDKSKWNVKLWNKADILKEKFDFVDDAAASVEIQNAGKYYEEIKRRLDFEYPYKLLSNIPAKITVTELKRLEEKELENEYSGMIFVPPLMKKPLFLDDISKISPIEKGSIMHLVMQHINIDEIPSKDYILSFVEKLVSEDFITEAQKTAVDADKIVEFFKSPLGIRMVKSHKVFREVPFYMEINAIDIYKDLPEGKYKNEHVILQGVIDCYFEEDDGIVLIDYKTDFVLDGKTEIIKDRYNTQIEYYAKALERITEKRVKEKYIYLFYNGEIIKF